MIISKKQVLWFFIVHLLIVAAISSLGYYPLILVILVFYYIGLIVERKSSVHMMFFLGYTTFIFLPAMLNWYYLDISLDLFYLTSFVAVFFLLQTRNTKVQTFIDKGNFLRFVFILSCLTSVFFIFIGLPKVVTYIFAFLIILMSMSFKQDRLIHNSFYFSLFMLVFLTYILFGWNGFGRTVTMSWLLLALLQFLYSINLNINKFIFSILPGVSASLLSSRDLFNLEFKGLEQSLYDSAYGPYRLASTFIDSFNLYGYDQSGFWDQITFTFLVFIPRSIWPNKPFGFGFEYTVRNLDTSLVEAGHSIAATLIGEHIYFLGYIGIITSILVLSIIAWFTNILYKLPGMNGNAVIIFSASMMALVWGGMSSFSARVILPSIVFLILFFIFRKFFNNNYSIVRRI